MNGADHLFAVILLVSLILGCVRGFVREAIALLSWLIGLWLAWHFAYLLYPWMGGALAEPGIREWTGRAIVLLLTLMAGSLVGAVVAHFLRTAAGLALVDRILGGLFGLMRAAVVIGLLVIGGKAVGLDQEPWWQKTRSMPVAYAVASWLEHYAEPAAAELLDRAAKTPGS